MKHKFAIIGDGHLASFIADAYCSGKMPAYELTGILGLDEEKRAALAARCQTRVASDLEDLLSDQPEIVVEVAAVAAPKQYALDILNAGVNFMPISIGAFADDDFRAAAMKAAEDHGVLLYFPSGAIGGFDLMQAMTLIGGASCEVIITARAQAYEGTPVYRQDLIDAGEKGLLYQGIAKDAIKILPTKVNIGIAASLATVGTDKTKVTIYGDPNMPRDDDMEIRIVSDKANATIKLYSQREALTGWSIAAFLNSLVSTVRFF